KRSHTTGSSQRGLDQQAGPTHMKSSINSVSTCLKVVDTRRSEASAPQVAREGSAREFAPLELQVVQSRSESRLWTELIERYHYLAYRVPVGANLRYLVRSRRSGEP